jgi:hypothetical protein
LAASCAGHGAVTPINYFVIAAFFEELTKGQDMAGVTSDATDFIRGKRNSEKNVELFDFGKNKGDLSPSWRSLDAVAIQRKDPFLTVSPLELRTDVDSAQKVIKLPDSFTIVRGADGKLKDVTGIDARYRDYVKMSDGSGGTLERVNGGRREEKFFLLTNRDGSFEISDYGPDGTKRISRFVDKPEYLPERELLLRKADLFKFSPEEKAKVVADIARFEVRAQQRGFSPQQVKETYQAIGRFFTEDRSAKLSLDTRVQLAQQVLSLVATPTAVDQGHHNSCTAASLESNIYARNPRLAANLVADIALTGQHKLRNGVVVQLSPTNLMPDDEAINHPPRDGDRGFASQLFQVTAVNSVYASSDGLIRWEYVQTRVNDEQRKIDTGERLRPFGMIPTHYDSPALSVPKVAEMVSLINGAPQPDILLAMYTERKNVNTFRNREQFEQKLGELHQKDNFPALLLVDTAAPPFNHRRGGYHLLNVLSYDPKTKLVQVDNQWGLDKDMIEKPVPIDELYKSTVISILERD